MTRMEDLNLLNYIEGKPLTLGNILGSLSQVHWSNMGLLTPSHCGEYASPGKLENPLSVVQYHTALNDRINIEDQSKISIEIRKHTFLKTSINYQRPKLKV